MSRSARSVTPIVFNTNKNAGSFACDTAMPFSQLLSVEGLTLSLFGIVACSWRKERWQRLRRRVSAAPKANGSSQSLGEGDIGLCGGSLTGLLIGATTC